MKELKHEDYNSVNCEIQFHEPSLKSGRRFLLTSFHELIHAKLFFTGDMHRYYNFLDMNYGRAINTPLAKRFAYFQAGLKIFSERWAYGTQWAQYNVNRSRINYIERMWNRIILDQVTPQNYEHLIQSF
jgi:hypothetical protein